MMLDAKPIMLNFIILNVYAECRYAECRYAECSYAECRGSVTPTETIQLNFFQQGLASCTVVEYTTANCEIEGSNPAGRRSAEGGKRRKKFQRVEDS